MRDCDLYELSAYWERRQEELQINKIPPNCGTCNWHSAMGCSKEELLIAGGESPEE